MSKFICPMKDLCGFYAQHNELCPHEILHDFETDDDADDHGYLGGCDGFCVKLQQHVKCIKLSDIRKIKLSKLKNGL